MNINEYRNLITHMEHYNYVFKCADNPTDRAIIKDLLAQIGSELIDAENEQATVGDETRKRKALGQAALLILSKEKTEQ